MRIWSFSLSISFIATLARLLGNKVSSYMARGDWERFLNNWISRYVLVDDQASGK
jgi:predicted component of type VI protein secretion system